MRNRVFWFFFFSVLLVKSGYGQSAALLNVDWITPAVAEGAGKRPSLEFVRDFKASGKVKSAVLHITALGLYEARLNGKRVGDAYFTPGFTSYSKRLQYQRYDVTALLRNENKIEVTVAEGWYRGIFRSFYSDSLGNNFGASAGLLAELEITYASGRIERVCTDDSWRCSESKIRFSELYDGELYDAGFVAGDWQPVKVLDHAKSMLVPAVSEPVRKQEVFKAVRSFRTPLGEQVIDFGQNMAGWVKLSVRGKAGDTVRLFHAEVLDSLGNFYTGNLRSAKAVDTYVLSGKGTEVFEPHFTYHGFRYVKLVGADVSDCALVAVAMYSDLVKTGTFSCSDPMVNQLQRNIEWSLNSNFFDIPTDCPQRSERLGWTGDAQVFAPTASFLRGTRNFYAKWLADLAAEQRDNGAVPVFIPSSSPLSVPVNGVAGWGDAATIIPWTLYEAYADTAILRQQYASMKAWVDYIDRQSPQGLWKANGYGDWYAQGDSTSLPLIDQAFFAHSAGIVAQAAGVLQQAADSVKYGQLAEKAKRLFAATYGDSLNTQTACILALQFKLLPEALQKLTAEKLVQLIHANNNHLATGFLGTPYLLPVLSAYGYSDLAYTLLNQKTCPSWLYPVTKGATTIWEKWDAIQPGGTVTESSYNHYSYGAVGRWLYEHVAGIRAAEPGYKKIIIKPEIGGGLTWAKASYRCDYGKIVSAWKIKNGKLSMNVEIPEGTTAEIYVPGEKASRKVGPGKYHF